MFDNKTIGERFTDLRKTKKDIHGKDMPIQQLAKELANEEYIRDYKSDVIRQEIGKVESKGKFPQLFLIEGYSKYFHVTSDYLLGLRNTKPIDENIAMISKVTGLSGDSIEMLKILTNYRNKNKDFLPGLGADIDAINILLEYQYQKTKQAETREDGSYYPAWSALHFIRQYISSGIYEREQQDRLRICDGKLWLDIEKGDILVKGNKKHTIVNMEAINSKSNSGSNTKKMNVVNIKNEKERYAVEINKIFQSYSRDNILNELDNIKAYIEKRGCNNNEIT